MSEIYEQLRGLRKERHLTLAEVGAQAGLSAAYLSEIERGQRAPLDSVVATLNKVLACYGMILHIEIREKEG
jgi:transcriptional regulator with XRE-family HTH domain